jgi:hypothetical protein
MDLQKLLILAAAVVLAFACRSFEHRVVRKLGLVAMMLASYLLGFFLTGLHLAGGFAVSLWFLLPWVEIATTVRRLRFPVARELKGRLPPSRDGFPELEEITEELVDHGFEAVEDAGWKWESVDHFLRLLYHPAARVEATIGLARQDGQGFSYVSVTSRTANGTAFTTTNYPFAPTMRESPQHRLNRYPQAESLDDLLKAHEQFLGRAGLGDQDFAAVQPEQLSARLQRDMGEQVEHNVRMGIIQLLGDGNFRYSWRGCFFLWRQVICDMLRL